MSLFRHIQKQVDGTVHIFCERLVEMYKHAVDDDAMGVEEMMRLWKEVSTRKRKISLKTKRKKSAYVVFSQHLRRVLKEEHPAMSFGDMSKEIGRRWKELSPSEKEAFKIDQGLTPAVATPITSAVEEEDLLEGMTTEVPVAGSSPAGSDTETGADKEEEDEKEVTVAVAETMTETVVETETMMVETCPIVESDNDDDDDDEDKAKTVVTDLATMYQQYKRMTVTELAQICKARNVTSKGIKKKESLIQLLMNHPS